MSFAIWKSKPPFPEEHLNEAERIYFQAKDGSWEHFDPQKSAPPEDCQWCVTDGGAPIQEQVDALLNPVAEIKSVDERLAAAGLTIEDIKEAVAK